MSKPKPALRHLPPGIWALGFVSVLVVGLIEGAAEATALIVKVFSGVLSDYWGKRKPLAVLGYGLAPPDMRGAAFGLRC